MKAYYLTEKNGKVTNVELQLDYIAPEALNEVVASKLFHHLKGQDAFILTYCDPFHVVISAGNRAVQFTGMDAQLIHDMILEKEAAFVLDLFTDELIADSESEDCYA